MREGTVVFVNKNKKKIESILCCRICHDEESSIPLETPCACSGTSKFAHRECIQRWCDEKGDTTCEICLKRYEPGYSAPEKKSKVMEEVVTISIPRGQDGESESDDALPNTEFSECSFQSASCCQIVALIVTTLLLLRHLLAVLSGEAGHYPFTQLTVLALKSCGIVAPMYIILLTISRIQTRLQMYHHHGLQHLHLVRYSRRNEPEQTSRVTIDIQSL